jgi:hypothetical protein
MTLSAVILSDVAHLFLPVNFALRQVSYVYERFTMEGSCLSLECQAWLKNYNFEKKIVVRGFSSKKKLKKKTFFISHIFETLSQPHIPVQ